MRIARKTQSHFAQAPQADIPRSSFDRSAAHKTTFNAGELVPIFVDEVLPGDTFSLSMTAFARFATPLHPLMDNMYMDDFWFFVPNRLVWNNWEKFNGAQDNPGDSTSFVIPQQVAPAVTGYDSITLQDYMGLPTKIPGFTHNALPLRAYNLIWNSWFRDENLQNSVVVDKGDGPDTVSNYVLLKRGKRHDYFTSGLPWPQKGPAVSLPIGNQAPVKGIGIGTDFTFPSVNAIVRESGGSGTVTFANARSFQNISGASMFVRGTATPGYPDIFADLSAATAATINQLRQAFQVQKLYERDARGGTRYTEIVRSHFGVVSPDARMQRPEYLGGGSAPVIISPVAQTSAASGQPTPQGNLTGFGTVNIHGHGFSKSFTEHGYIIGLVSVRADMTYQQGLNRMWSRSTRFDFYWPALSHIGEQVIKNQEIYCQGSANPAQDAAAFAYQEAWAEYRYRPGQISGAFRSNYTGTLDSWHLAQNFASLPVLNNTFIVENPPVSRVVAVTSEPHFLFDSDIRLRCARPMPMFSVPGLIDHF